MTLNEKKTANRLYWMQHGTLMPAGLDDSRIMEIQESINTTSQHFNETAFESAWASRMMILG